MMVMVVMMMMVHSSGTAAAATGAAIGAGLRKAHDRSNRENQNQRCDLLHSFSCSFEIIFEVYPGTPCLETILERQPSVLRFSAPWILKGAARSVQTQAD
jgi:hypothetical protein